MLINLPHLCAAGSNLHIAGCTGCTQMRLRVVLQIYDSVHALLCKLKRMQLYLSNPDFVWHTHPGAESVLSLAKQICCFNMLTSSHL